MKKPDNPIFADILEARQANTLDEMRHVQVPEWSTEEKTFVIYYRNFNLDDVDYIARMAGANKGKSLAFTVIRKALNEDGTKMFSVKDILFLTKKIESNTMVNIVNAMNKAHTEADYQGE